MLTDFYSKVLSNLHPKLEFDAFLRTKWTGEASCARKPQYCHCFFLTQIMCGPNSWWHKRTLVKAVGGAKELWSNWCLHKKPWLLFCRPELWPKFFCATSSFDQSSFAKPAAWPLVLRKASNSNLDVSYSKISYKSYKTYNAVSHNFFFLPNTIIKNIWWNSFFKGSSIKEQLYFISKGSAFKDFDHFLEYFLKLLFCIYTIKRANKIRTPPNPPIGRPLLSYRVTPTLLEGTIVSLERVGVAL